MGKKVSMFNSPQTSDSSFLRNDRKLFKERRNPSTSIVGKIIIPGPPKPNIHTQQYCPSIAVLIVSTSNTVHKHDKLFSIGIVQLERVSGTYNLTVIAVMFTCFVEHLSCTAIRTELLLIYYEIPKFKRNCLPFSSLSPSIGRQMFENSLQILCTRYQ